jgi:long-chain acyl-CoA synthetase
MATVQHVFENLLSAEAETPERVALEFMGQPITYGALAQNARKLASGLRAHGVEPGQSVGLILPNIPHFAEALYGSWLNGNVVVPMNVLLTAPEIRYLVEDSSIRALFVFQMFVPQVEAAIADLPNPPRVFVVGEAGPHTPYTALIEGQEPVTPREASADEHVLTIYTSGTTGKPKGAVITNRNVLAQLDMTDDLFPPQEGDRVLCVLPLFHVFALNGVLNANIRHRGTIVLHVKFDLDPAVQSLKNDRISIFAGVPTMYFYILKHPEIATLKFPSLRYCVSGGAAMPVDVMHSFEDKFGVPIYEGYGLTETTVSVCCNREGAKKVGSVGKPYPGVQLKIVDDAGKPLPGGERGEIAVKGPNIMQGYLNRPEATAEAVVDGWLHTGDVGYVDEEGFVFIVDRKKDLIIKGGYNIYPREIEEVLYQMPQVAEAAVVGVQDDAKGEQVRAIISPRPGATLDAQQVESWLKQNLAKYKLPSEYVFMEELPKGPTGKILKRELRG